LRSAGRRRLRAVGTIHEIFFLVISLAAGTGGGLAGPIGQDRQALSMGRCGGL
jgi:hypothetical protein